MEWVTHEKQSTPSSMKIFSGLIALFVVKKTD